MLPRVAWASKDNLIAAFLFSNSANANGAGVLDLIDVKGHESRRVLPGWWLIDQPGWTVHGKTLIVSAATRVEGRNHAQIREIDLKSGQIHDIQKDLAGYTSSSLTRDEQQLAAGRVE